MLGQTFDKSRKLPWQKLDKINFKPFKLAILALFLTISCGSFLSTVRAELIGVGLGEDNPDAYGAEVHGISGDGNVVVGASFGSSGGLAFKFDGSTFTSLAGYPGNTPEDYPYAHAYAASYDGSVIVGYAGPSSEGQGQAVRWVNDTPDFFLNELTLASRADGVSGDGTVIVGQATPQAGQSAQAFVWTEGTSVPVWISFSPILSSWAHDVSKDGNVVVGSASNFGNSFGQAFVWTDGGGIVDLGTLDGHNFSYANAISADSTVAVGVSSIVGGAQEYREAVVWTVADGPTSIVGLGRSDGTYSEAIDVSADGSVIVGYDDLDATILGSDWEAVRWFDSGSGYTMQSIADWLTANDIDVSGWQLNIASGVSDDGTVIVGTAILPSGNAEGFIATVAASPPVEPPVEPPPAPPTGIIGVTDFTNSLGDVNKGLALGHKINTLMGRVVSNFASSGPNMLSDHLRGKTILSPVVMYADGSEIMAAGIALEHVYDAVAIKVAIAGVDAEDDGRYNGELELSGYSLSLALNMYPGKMMDTSAINPLNITIGYGRGFYDGDFDRTYLNGATPEASNGEPDVDTMSAFIEAGWLVALSEKASIRPYAELFYQETEMDSYTETGGSFSGRVSSQDEDNTKYSLGLEGILQVNDHFRIGADVVGVKLRDGQGPDLTVTVPGVSTFVYPGVKYDDTWAEFALNAQWSFTSNLWLGGEVRGTTGSDYPEDWSASVELSYVF